MVVKVLLSCLLLLAAPLGAAPAKGAAAGLPTAKALGLGGPVLVADYEGSTSGKMNLFRGTWSPQEATAWFPLAKVPAAVQKESRLLGLEGRFVLGSNYLHAGQVRKLGTFRLTGAKVFLGLDYARGWVEGLREGSTWTFPRPGGPLILHALGEAFTPTDIHAWAWTGASEVHGQDHGTGLLPFSSGGVLVYGRNGQDIRGVFRLPLVPKAIPLTGYELQPGVIYLESSEEASTVARFRLVDNTENGVDLHRGLLAFPAGQGRIRFLLEGGNVKVCFLYKGDFPGGDFVAMTAVGALVRGTDLVPLPGLESLAEGHLDDPAWLHSDNLGGFLNASDSALAAHGTPVELPIAATDGHDPQVQAKAAAVLQPLAERAKAFKVKVLPRPQF